MQHHILEDSILHGQRLENLKIWVQEIWNSDACYDAELQMHTYLQRRALCRQGRESHNVAEIDGDAVVRLRYYWLSQDQLTSDRPAHKQHQSGVKMSAECAVHLLTKIVCTCISGEVFESEICSQSENSLLQHRRIEIHVTEL